MDIQFLTHKPMYRELAKAPITHCIMITVKIFFCLLYSHFRMVKITANLVHKAV